MNEKLGPSVHAAAPGERPSNPESYPPPNPPAAGGCADWANLVPPEQWGIYVSAMESLESAGVAFMLGGAFGLAAYTGRWRNTKDMDFYVLPSARHRAIEAVTQAGFVDYYPILPYDRGWIYRATRQGVIADVIWSTPNRRGDVDQAWFERARRLRLRGKELSAIPAEELAWIKLYVMQRDRCDWPDVINLLYAAGATLDWNAIMQRLEDDLPLLQGLVAVFAWLCPDKVHQIPASVRDAAGIRVLRQVPSGPDQRRIGLLDSRPWFAALQPCDRPMQL